MTTPVERVERLREETAKASRGHPSWRYGRWPEGSHYIGVTETDTDEMVVYDEGSPSEHQARHIARWDPEAATKVLDLLAWVFVWHSVDDPAYPAAMAVLDALDGAFEPSATTVESPKGEPKETT